MYFLCTSFSWKKNRVCVWVTRAFMKWVSARSSVVHIDQRWRATKQSCIDRKTSGCLPFFQYLSVVYPDSLNNIIQKLFQVKIDWCCYSHGAVVLHMSVNGIAYVNWHVTAGWAVCAVDPASLAVCWSHVDTPVRVLTDNYPAGKVLIKILTLSAIFLSLPPNSLSCVFLILFPSPFNPIFHLLMSLYLFAFFFASPFSFVSISFFLVSLFSFVSFFLLPFSCLSIHVSSCLSLTPSPSLCPSPCLSLCLFFLVSLSLCLTRLQEDPPTGVSGAPSENNIMLWNAVIFGWVMF